MDWLPFKNIINYEKLCISIHISEIEELEAKLICITEDMYNKMLDYYQEIKHLFELEGICNFIINENK